MGCMKSAPEDPPETRYKERPKTDKRLPKAILQPTVVQNPSNSPEMNWVEANQEITGQMFLVRTPADERNILFKQEYEMMYLLPPGITQFPKQNIKKCPFQVKLAWLRANLEKLRIPWDQSHQRIIIDRQNIVFSGMQAFSSTDLHQQIKIDFLQQNDDDAGGLLRGWMHMCVKQIFSEDIGAFEICKTDNTAYKIRRARDTVPEILIKVLQLLGLIIGKAIFERISLGCFLNKALIRVLCSSPIHLQDIYSFDKDLYNSWVAILMDENVQEYGLTYSIFHTNQDNQMVEKQLIPNGNTINITEENKAQYIQDAIYYYCYDSAKQYIDVLKRNVHKVIPQEYLSVFQPYQFDLILNGPNHVDISQWKKHTIYEGFETEDEIIVSFWQIIQNFNHNEIRNFLHFCTGVTRIPVHGFSRLQSNRSEIRKFKIVKIEYEGQYMYPKAHTCFNRLQLPEYPTEQQLQQKLTEIAQIENNWFGLD